MYNQKHKIISNKYYYNKQTYNNNNLIKRSVILVLQLNIFGSNPLNSFYSIIHKIINTYNIGTREFIIIIMDYLKTWRNIKML